MVNSFLQGHRISKVFPEMPLQEYNSSKVFMAQQFSLKYRVDVLEQELASLKARIDGKAASPWWIELFGVCKDDPLFDEAMRLGAQYRKSLRPQHATKRAGKKHVSSGH